MQINSYVKYSTVSEVLQWTNLLNKVMASITIERSLNQTATTLYICHNTIKGRVYGIRFKHIK